MELIQVMEKLPISAYIRTKNEERCIAEVIEAAYKICDEVVIVDSESTDQTREIAAELGAKVVLQPWLGNGHQKRIGEEQAKHDWVLDIDADEIISDELASEIHELFSQEHRYTAFRFRIITYPPIGKVWHNCGVAHRIKLYDKTHHRIPAHAAWDQFKVEDRSVVKSLKGGLIHYSFSSIEHMTGKMNRVSSVRAHEKKLKPLPVVTLRVLFFFHVYFFRNLIKRKMFLRGVYGFSCAAVLAFSRWLTDVKMYEVHMEKLNKVNKRS